MVGWGRELGGAGGEVMVGYQFDRYLNPLHILLLVFHYLFHLDLDNGPLFSIPVHIKMKI